MRYRRAAGEQSGADREENRAHRRPAERRRARQAHELPRALSPFDPIAFAGVAAILALTGFLATLLPVRRALGVDPAVTLRQDT